MGRASWLKKETYLWAEKGIISREQADQIAGLYPEDHKNRLISILLILGAILLGAGIILFFASNWQYLPRWLKIGLVIVPLVSFHLSSQLTHTSYPKLSAVLSLLGCIMFGSGIWLIAQIYHINAYFPNGILFWFLGVLPVAFFLREPLPLALSSLLLGFWVVAERSSSPATIFMALLFFAVVFYLIYNMRSSFAGRWYYQCCCLCDHGDVPNIRKDQFRLSPGFLDLLCAAAVRAVAHAPVQAPRQPNQILWLDRPRHSGQS
ncbi:MAG: DUF2157 domain-containing protein [Bacillota bacterium]